MRLGVLASSTLALLTTPLPASSSTTTATWVCPSRRQRAYRPNNESGPRRVPSAWLAVLPQLVLLVANAVLPFYAIMVGRVPARLIAANIAISALAIWSLLPVVLGAVHAPPAPVAEAPREVVDGLA